MSELNKNFEENAVKEFDSTSLDALIDELETTNRIEDIEGIIKELDDNKNNKLTKNEELLLENIKSKKKVIGLLKGILRRIEKKENIKNGENNGDDYIEIKKYNFKIEKNISKNKLEKKIEEKISKLNFREVVKLIEEIHEGIKDIDIYAETYVKKGTILFNEVIFDLYLKNLEPEKAEKIIEESGKILEEKHMCPKNERLIRIRTKILENKKSQFLLKAKEFYGDDIGGTLQGFIKGKMEKIKNSKNPVCSISIISYIQDFEKKDVVKKYLKQNKKEGLSKQPDKIRQLIDGILEIKKSEIKIDETKKFQKLGINQTEFQNISKGRQIKLLKEKGFNKKEIIKIKKELSENKVKISKIKKSQNFIKSLNNDEFEIIIKEIQETPEKDLTEIRKKIEETRKEKLKNDYFESEDRLNFREKIGKVPTEITENNSITVDGVIIDGITENEYKSFGIVQEEGKILNIENPEALKNLVNMKEKLSYLKLDFAWENRNELMNIMKNLSDFEETGVKINDKNLIDNREFNIYLKFLLKIAGEKSPSDLESENFAKIREINKESITGTAVNFNSGMSNFGNAFIKAGYLNNFGNKTLMAKSNLLNYYKKNINGEKSQEK